MGAPGSMSTTRTILSAVAVAWATVAPSASSAADWYTGASPEAAAGWLVSTDTSATVTSTGSVFGAASATGSATGTLRDSGARLRVQAIGGRYEYTTGGGTPVTGTQVEGSLLAGYEWVGARSAVAAYLGVTARDNQISVADPHNPVVGTTVGLKGVLEAYAEPTARTMASGYASYATAHNAYFGRLRFGYDVGDRIFVGPELAALGDDFFQQWRIGAHVTGLRLGPFDLALAAGVLSDRRQGLGAFTTLDARAGF